VAVDAAGRIFLVGVVGGAADGLTYAGGAKDVFVLALNGSTGAKLWSQMVGSNGTEVSYGVAVDGPGSVFATGYTNSRNLDGQGSAGGDDVFLVRFNSSSGTKVWTRMLGSTNDEEGLAVAVDRNSVDAVYVGGYTKATSRTGLPGSTGGLGGNSDAFLARYTMNGSLVWLRQFGSGDDDGCLGVAVYQSEIYATGFTDGIMASSGNAEMEDIFVARITALGVVAWTAQLGSPGNDRGLGIAVDVSGVYVTGRAGGSLNGEPYVGNGDAFVARYTHTGLWSWTRILGTSSDDRSRSVALDLGGNVRITGNTGGALGGQTNVGSIDVFVASFTSGGVLQWTRLYGTASSDMGHSIAADESSGTVVLGGRTDGSLHGQPSLGSSDLFVMKIQ
jgi:hypothetical protein